jgi:hypothetical protein
VDEQIRLSVILAEQEGSSHSLTAEPRGLRILRCYGLLQKQYYCFRLTSQAIELIRDRERTTP